MSIWASWRTIGWDDEDDLQRGEVRSYAHGWGNHYPTTDGAVEQLANVDLAYIPGYCVPGYADDVYADMATGPWLRLYVSSREYIDGKPVGPDTAAVILDVAAARHLAEDLIEWVNQPHNYPMSTP